LRKRAKKNRWLTAYRGTIKSATTASRHCSQIRTQAMAIERIKSLASWIMPLRMNMRMLPTSLVTRAISRPVC